MPDINKCTQLAVKQAYEMAGVGPEDINLIELHDFFANAEMLHYKNLGICGEGEAGRMIDEGETALGGRGPASLAGRCPSSFGSSDPSPVFLSSPERLSEFPRYLGSGQPDII